MLETKGGTWMWNKAKQYERGDDETRGVHLCED